MTKPTLDFMLMFGVMPALSKNMRHPKLHFKGPIFVNIHHFHFHRTSFTCLKIFVKMTTSILTISQILENFRNNEVVNNFKIIFK